MKLVFAHDHVFYVTQGRFYSNGGLSPDVLDRYLAAFGQLTVLSRQRKIEDRVMNLTEVSIDGVSLVSVPDFKSVSKCWNLFKAKRTIEERVREADLLIARLPSSIGSLSIRYARKHGVPYAIEVVGCAWDALWHYGNFLGKLYAPFAHLSLRMIARRSSYALYVTSEFLQKKYPCPGLTVACSNVEIPLVDDAVLMRRLEKIDSKMDYDPIRLGLIGSLKSEYKGFDVAIRAVKILSKRFRTLELYVVGPGSADKWVELARAEKVEDRVHFLGSLKSGAEIFEWLDDIDVYIQPSKTEGLPRATIEAMSRGCPVVGARVGGIPELIDNRFVHGVGNGGDLASRIAALIEDKNLLKSQAESNFRKSKQYEKGFLDKKRNEFWGSIIQSVTVVGSGPNGQSH